MQSGKNKKSHTCGDSYRTLCFGNGKGFPGWGGPKKLQRIHLSYNIIRSRIDEIGADILDKVMSDIKSSSSKILVQ